MRWPWRKNAGIPEPSDSSGLERAIKAREGAERDLKEAREKRRDVEQIVSSLRRIREEDPLAVLFLDSLKSNAKRPNHG